MVTSRTLFLISSLLIFVWSCAPSRTKGLTPQQPMGELWNPYFSDAAKDYVYQVQMTYKTHNFGGILAIKKIGTNVHRIVCTGGIGNTLFDLELKADNAKFNQILAVLDRKPIRKLLVQDFTVLTQENPRPTRSYLQKNNDIFEVNPKQGKLLYFMKANTLDKIERYHWGKMEASYQFRSPNGIQASKIEVLHPKKGLSLTLTALD